MPCTDNTFYAGTCMMAYGSGYMGFGSTTARMLPDAYPNNNAAYLPEKYNGPSYYKGKWEYGKPQ